MGSNVRGERRPWAGTASSKRSPRRKGREVNNWPKGHLPAPHASEGNDTGPSMQNLYVRSAQISVVGPGSFQLMRVLLADASTTASKAPGGVPESTLTDLT